MDELHTTIRPYAWGSRTALARLQERAAPSLGPEAELWAGAHPGAPSSVVRNGRPVELHRVLAGDPLRELGAEVVAEFGPQLPFLLKVLAVEEPLSLQAHPDGAQARAGFAAEEASGVPRDSPFRNYRDSSPKPELICAVTPFEALCGFRPVPGTVRLLDHLLDGWGVAPLVPYADRLRAGGPAALREVVTGLLGLDGERRTRLVDAVGEACAAAVEKAGGSDPDLDPAADPDARTYGRIADLAERHPGDTGVVVALLLNHLWLEPGQAMFVPAGGLHAYLHGVGVEVMANSDNVLRGGLTPKHIDSAALLGVLRFDAEPIVPVEPVVDAAGTCRWPVLAREFSLERTVVGDHRVVLPTGRPQIVLCMEGAVRLTTGAGSIDIRGGGAVFVPAGDPEVTVTGRGVVFRAAPGT